MPIRCCALLVLLATQATAQVLAPGAAAALQLSTFVGSGVPSLTDFRFLPGGRMVITLKTGQVLVRRADGTLVQAGAFSVDSSSEKGLLGVEVHPQFGAGTTRTLFFYVSASNAAGGTDLDRHRVVAAELGDDDRLAAAQTVLLRGLRGPANHDGGALAIGPDGKLYVGVGDTGCNSALPPPPPESNIHNYTATCLTTANGKVLRLNLDGSIPADNPLVGSLVPACDATACTPGPDPSNPSGAPRTEIWAWGFRNPFRFSFDAQTGSLWVGDVGEVTYEEIDVVTRGQHYGWPYREGGVGDPVSVCANLGPGGGGTNCVEPKYFCRHGADSGGVQGGCQSITGGVFVDNPAWPAAFRGLYYFGDNALGRAWTLTPNAARDGFVAGSRQDLASGLDTPVRFLVGPDQNLYIGLNGGAVLLVRPTVAADGGAAPGAPGGGCGCRSAPGFPAAALMLLAWLRHRRRPAKMAP
jgi:glucose/arabinose dehydrogenase